MQFGKMKGLALTFLDRNITMIIDKKEEFIFFY